MGSRSVAGLQEHTELDSCPGSFTSWLCDLGICLCWDLIIKLEYQSGRFKIHRYAKKNLSLYVYVCIRIHSIPGTTSVQLYGLGETLCYFWTPLSISVTWRNLTGYSLKGLSTLIVLKTKQQTEQSKKTWDNTGQLFCTIKLVGNFRAYTWLFPSLVWEGVNSAINHYQHSDEEKFPVTYNVWDMVRKIHIC